MDMESHCGEFRAMGTVISLRSVGVSHATMTRALEVLQAEAARWERIFSRFDAESELSRVNRSNGESVRVSHDFLDVLDDAIAGFIQSAGRFDPSILDTLELEGYDRTFQSIRPGDERDGPERFRHVDSWKLLDIKLDFHSGTVRLPAGLRIDLGGIAKGAFVDRMIINLLVEDIKADLRLTDTQISLLQGLAFALFYAVMAVPLGRLADTCLLYTSPSPRDS